MRVGPSSKRWTSLLPVIKNVTICEESSSNSQAWIAVADVVLWATAQHASDQGWLCNVGPYDPFCPSIVEALSKELYYRHLVFGKLS